MNHSVSAPSSRSAVRRPWLALVAAASLALAGAMAPDLAEAKRLGGGKSSGMNRNMPERTAPGATTATPAPAAGPTAAAPNAATAQAAKPAAAAPAAAAAQPKRSWLGPLAGLAAGFGLAALFSHLGLGAEFGSLILMALLAVAAFMVFKMLRNRGASGSAPALAGAGAGTAGGGSMPTPWSNAPAPMQRQGLDAPVLASPASVGPAAAANYSAPAAAVFVPAAFDSEGFERTAKAIFIRMQAANDAANLSDLAQFTTPELFAQIKLELLDRGTVAQSTDVQKLEAKVLDVVEEHGQSVVSVRYSGTVVEAAGQAPLAIDEVWHLVKAHDSERWMIAGIEQMS